MILSGCRIKVADAAQEGIMSFVLYKLSLLFKLPWGCTLCHSMGLKHYPKIIIFLKK